MNIVVNGEPHELTPPETLGHLMKELGVEPDRVAVMINGRIVPKAGRAEVGFTLGDRVEILTFMGGG